MIYLLVLAWLSLLAGVLTSTLEARAARRAAQEAATNSEAVISLILEGDKQPPRRHL